MILRVHPCVRLKTKMEPENGCFSDEFRSRTKGAPIIFQVAGLVFGGVNIQLLGKVSTYCSQLLDIKKLFLRGPCLQYLTEQELYLWKGVHRHKVHNFKLGMKLLAIFCPVNPGKNHSYWEYLVGG